MISLNLRADYNASEDVAAFVLCVNFIIQLRILIYNQWHISPSVWTEQNVFVGRGCCREYKL